MLTRTVNNRQNHRKDKSTDKVQIDLSNGIPKAPDQFWIKKLLKLDHRNRPKPSTPFVTPTSHGDTERPGAVQTPTAQPSPQTDDVTTAGPEHNAVVEHAVSGLTIIRASDGANSALIGGDIQDPSSGDDDPGALFLSGDAPGEHTSSATVPLPSVAEEPTLDTVPPDGAAIQTVEEEDDEEKRLENAQRERFALRHVYMSLEHCMKDYERKVAALRIDMEDHKDSRRISVTCYAGAVDKAREIEAILFRAGKGLQGYSFVVRRNKDTRIFGFKGPGGAQTRFGDAHYSFGDSYNTFDKSQRGGQAFSKTPYWNPELTMVEILCADRPGGNVTAAPIRMEVERVDGSSATCSWTCGGIVRVGDVNYGLTTAHPLVLGDIGSPETPPLSKRPLRDKAMSDDFFADEAYSGGASDFFSMEEHPEDYWQTIGKVSHYALARIGSLPCNNDWLLFELPKDRIVWSDFSRSQDPDQHPLAVFTAHGVLNGSLQEGTAFLILGNSPFEVLKFSLNEPLRSGDSGSWVMQGSKLVGVMIGGSEEDPNDPIGYAISADEVYRNISRSMGGVTVRQLTYMENLILARTATENDRLPYQLVALRIRQLFSPEEHVGTIVTPLSHQPNASADGKTDNAALASFLELGTFCSAFSLRPSLAKRYRAKPTFYWKQTERAGRSLCRKILQYKEGQLAILLVIALSGAIQGSKHFRVSRSASMLSVIMTELRISPLPALDRIRAVVNSALGRYKPVPPAHRIDLIRMGLSESARHPILGMLYPMLHEEEYSLARSLGRTLYALSTNDFFSHAGEPAQNLGKFLAIHTAYPVVMFDEYFPFGQNSEQSLDHALRILGTAPRIFIANVHHLLQSRFHPYYGDVVSCDELSELLESMKTAVDMGPPHDPLFEKNASYGRDSKFKVWYLLFKLRRTFNRHVRKGW